MEGREPLPSSGFVSSGWWSTSTRRSMTAALLKRRRGAVWTRGLSWRRSVWKEVERLRRERWARWRANSVEVEAPEGSSRVDSCEHDIG